jgi:hypothetical protein
MNKMSITRFAYQDILVRNLLNDQWLGSDVVIRDRGPFAIIALEHCQENKKYYERASENDHRHYVASHDFLTSILLIRLDY